MDASNQLPTQPDAGARSAGEISRDVLSPSAERAPLWIYSERMKGVMEIVEKVADTNATVLIHGESGVGKELVAKAIHALSPRRDRPFVRVNCAALPGELLESELFGYEKGAFTGAYKRNPGKFEYGNHGTIFLDEIADLPIGLQAKLLHFLQDNEFSRIGGRELIRVDTRVIAATHRDLVDAVRRAEFREDLYYRLNVVAIVVPPLRDRREAIPHLASEFLRRFNAQYNRRVEISPELMERLVGYDWPGNVRELENAVKRLVVLGSGTALPPGPFGQGERRPDGPATPAPGPREPVSELNLKEIARRAARDAECRAIKAVLEKVYGNRAAAAKLLKISYKALLYKIEQCGLGSKRAKPPSG